MMMMLIVDIRLPGVSITKGLQCGRQIWTIVYCFEESVSQSVNKSEFHFQQEKRKAEKEKEDTKGKAPSDNSSCLKIE